MNKPIRTGDTFGKLTVVARNSDSGIDFAACKCSCGGRITATWEKLRNGSITNCGCEGKK